ncbi:MAG: AarF/ABC1/UbiB kinase family protein [Syntrophomonadaceae bacterium]|nr:AarF/ABC1/UbiB kinase family protein [Syntrophomonadaceae bacterium]
MVFRQLDHMRRYRQVLNRLGHHGFGFILDQMGLSRFKTQKKADYYRFSVPERIRMVLEELGATFVKLGQLLSLRPDLIPASFIKELEKLQDEVPPFPPQQVRMVLESAGLDIASLFSEFDFEPIASASIGQVHRAVLMNGHEVAVKVQRPEVSEQVAIDLDILEELARVAEKRTKWGQLYQLDEVVQEFSRAIRAEIDFAQEGRNAMRFYELFLDNPEILIPKVVWELTSERVLVMDYLAGIKISEIESLEASGADLNKIAQNIVDSLFSQVYEEGYFHSDPHPGNMAVAPGNKLIYYDFGQVGQIDEMLKQQGMDLVLAMVRYDVNGVTRALLDLGVARKSVDREELRKDISRLQRKYYGIPMSQIKMGEALTELIQLSLKFQIRIPPELSQMVKMLMTVEGVIINLDPQLSLIKVAEPLGRKILKERQSPQKMLRMARDMVLEYVSLARSIPREADTVLSLLQEGELKVKIENSNMKSNLNRAEVLVNRISITIIIASLIIGTSLMSARMPSGFLSKIPLAEAGFFLAVALGLFLVYSIIRRGRF